MSDWTDEEWSSYIREVNAAYWEEEIEFELGIHPTQRMREENLTFFMHQIVT